MTVSKWLSLLMTVCWVLFGVTLVIRLTAGSGGYLAAQMLEYAPPEESGLPESEYPGMGNMIADYLTGRTDEFQYVFTDENGMRWKCFREYEAVHMADCRRLISLDTAVMAASGASALILLVVCIARKKDRRECFAGIRLGLGGVMGIAAALVIWAAVDFHGFFITFHRVAFTNDGWLLNPATDMLIRLMPAAFFISLGIRGALPALIIPAQLSVISWIGLRKTKNRENV